MNTSAHSPCGFSLVEVVLALGVISFAIVAVLGLLSVGLNSGKCSMDESLVAVMSRQIIGNLRRQQFSTVSIGVTNVAEDQLNDATKALIQTAYFDVNGTRLYAANGVDDITQAAALQQNVVYQCTVKAQGVGDPAASLTLLDINLTFTWPVGAPKPNTVSLRTALAKYN